MSKEYDALTALKTYLPSAMNPSPQQALSADQIAIEYPDVDRMPFDTMLFIVPDEEEFQYVTVNAMESSLDVKIYILLRKQVMAQMIPAAFDYLTALVSAVTDDETLGGAIQGAQVKSASFYPAIAGVSNAVGIEVSAMLNF